jgi:DNA replication protein DnaC
MDIAILGAPQTGKTQLAQALRTHLMRLKLDLNIHDAALPEPPQKHVLVLLCGLDLAPASEHQLAADTAIRALLQRHKHMFQVVYGEGLQRLENALYCLARQLPQLTHGLARQEVIAKWQGMCETCGDGECEHRLFTQLVQR